MAKEKIAAVAAATTTATNIYNEYFNETAFYQNKYGPRTIVLMQVGAFFEVYGIKGDGDSDGEVDERSLISDFCRICKLKKAEKSKDRYQNQQLFMAGFGEFYLEQYIQFLIQEGITVVVFIQVDDMSRAGGKKKRIFQGVYSTATYIPLLEQNEACVATTITNPNHILCVWIETFQTIGCEKKWMCGISVINCLNGYSYLYEFSTPSFMNPTSFDDIERAISSFSPTEIIFISNETEDNCARIIQYTGMNKVLFFHLRRDMNDEKIVRCRKKHYIEEMVNQYFCTGFQVASRAFEFCAEFQTFSFATQTFCYLLDFIQEHNPRLVGDIQIPIFSNVSNSMVLANHTLRQLNFLPTDGSATADRSLSSVWTFLDRTCSAMGARLFKTTILQPYFCVEKLQKQYTLLQQVIDMTTRSLIRTELSHIKDLSKIHRQIILRRVNPMGFVYLYDGVQRAQKIATYATKIISTEQAAVIRRADEFILFLQGHLCLGDGGGIGGSDNDNASDAPKRYIKHGINNKLDILYEKYEKEKEIFLFFHKELNSLGGAAEGAIKIHETAKSGLSLQITQTRATTLKKMLIGGAAAAAAAKFAERGIDIKEIKFSSARTERMEMIEHPLLTTACKNLILYEDKIEDMMRVEFQKFVDKCEENWGNWLSEICIFLAEIDVLQSKATIAIENNYCCPFIEDKYNGISYLDARNLRHILIEHIQKNEIYVPNDVAVGGGAAAGILLFGINSVGKTSLIRSVGIAVIMAQAGMFVPCSSFTFFPYRGIYSRILGNDDLFKGLSTFMVEMSELRTILKMADSNCLVLGDELCSGTENESALGIFTAGLMHLKQQGASFIFATHFHEIINYDEIKELCAEGVLALKHMRIEFVGGRLRYDRKLRNGSGDAIYGLEVAKSLLMPPDFIEKAFEIRNKYFPVRKSPLAYKESSYNSEKIRGRCENCGAEGEEIHHIEPQKAADARGFIGTFHKNHKANLRTLCHRCHAAEHAAAAANTE